MDERLQNDFVLGAWLKNLRELEVFGSQLEIENRILASCRKDLESLNLQSSNLGHEYLRVRSMIDAIKQLQAVRERLIENRNPALKEKN